MRTLILCSLVTLGACTAKDGDSQAPDSGDADITGTFRFADLLSGASLDGVAIHGGDLDGSSDADGAHARPFDPNQPTELIATKQGYLDDHVFLRTGDSDFSLTVFMVEADEIARLYAIGGLTPDPAKGLVVVTINDDPEGGSHDLEGATVTLDAASDPPAAADSSSPTGFSPGNTTLMGANGWVAFPNVTAGDVHVEVVTPEGEECVVFPGDTDDAPFRAVAGAMSAMGFECE